jgi:hypothetical protein
MDGIFICGIVFYAIYKIIELFVRQKERKLMITKMSEISPEMLQSNVNLLQSATNNSFSSNQFSMLRLGGLALGIGTGWILGLVINFTQLNIPEIYASENFSYKINMENMMNSTYIATTAFCTGIALIIVYLIERKALQKSK